MAEKLQDVYECEITITPGGRGEFSIWITPTSPSEPVLIIQKEGYHFPNIEEVIIALDKYLDSSS